MSSQLLCHLQEIEQPGALGFAIGDGDWPLQVFVVRYQGEVFAYLNRCPHAGHQLNWRPHQFFEPEQKRLLCTSHGAQFEPDTGLCIAGPCLGKHLVPMPLDLQGDQIRLDPEALAAVPGEQMGDPTVIRQINSL